MTVTPMTANFITNKLIRKHIFLPLVRKSYANNNNITCVLDLGACVYIIERWFLKK